MFIVDRKYWLLSVAVGPAMGLLTIFIRLTFNPPGFSRIITSSAAPFVGSALFGAVFVYCLRSTVGINWWRGLCLVAGIVAAQYGALMLLASSFSLLPETTWGLGFFAYGATFALIVAALVALLLPPAHSVRLVAVTVLASGLVSFSYFPLQSILPSKGIFISISATAVWLAFGLVYAVVAALLGWRLFALKPASMRSATGGDRSEAGPMIMSKKKAIGLLAGMLVAAVAVWVVSVSCFTADCYNSRGFAFGREGQHDKAIEDYNEAIRLKPDDARTHINRGNIFARMGQHDKAIEDYNEAIRLRPDYALAYNNRGIAFKRQGQYDKAIEDYNEAIRLKPGYATAYINRGNAFDRKGQYDKAIEDYKRAIELNFDRKTTARASNSLSWLHASAKDPAFRNGPEAVKYARKAVSLDIRAPYIGTLAAAYVENRQPNEAVVQYERAVKFGGEKRVRRYQKDLRKKGYYTGAIDGEFSPETRKALVACVNAGCKLLVD